ncbi:zinc transport system substrate-binding protein [Paracoccus aminovorans]|uniref:High-affinity zinc uptake system protein ZnuA n=1 Tax=Paracoccus aminovorans TaxID=34004 RepID=A0A1I2X7X8_9RHOB|nr:zinc ABC transporter substrate-binding protein [Paracoccus aminovorans]CQR85567.1 zinc ABC transporter periplasmic zinc-binding protein ZnuA [Paracoccus aminovorans]SFH09634.1 zinc transport system substrate-binding protein [Paracoccus aminovorans]
MNRHTLLFLSAALGATALPALAEVPRVVTDIPVVHSLVQQVMGTLGQPALLLAAGGDPHHYQLRPSDARSLQEADLLVWVGPALTPWLERPAADLAAKGNALALLDQPGTRRQDFAGGAHDHDDDIHDHDHDHEGHDHAHGEEGHHHSGVDPHAWLDPGNGAAWVQAIAQALSARDPEHAATYAANAEQAAAGIAALDGELQAALAPAKGKRFVVFHDAYGYFTSHFGLEPAIAVSLGDASTPSAARLKAIRAEIGAEGAACAFPEANHDPRLIAAVTEGSAVRSGGALDPEGSAAAPGPGLYAELLRGMAGTLADCLGQN